LSVVSSVGDLRYAIYEPTEGNTPNGIRTRVNRKSEIANPASAGRPGHFAAAENVKVQVRDGFAGVGSVVEDEAESVFEAELFGDFPSFEEQMSKDGVVRHLSFRDARDGLLGDDQDVHRRLRFDVVESDHPVVLVNDGGGNFARDDFFKQRFAHVQYRGPNGGDSDQYRAEYIGEEFEKGQHEPADPALNARDGIWGRAATLPYQLWARPKVTQPTARTLAGWVEWQNSCADTPRFDHEVSDSAGSIAARR